MIIDIELNFCYVVCVWNSVHSKKPVNLSNFDIYLFLFAKKY